MTDAELDSIYDAADYLMQDGHWNIVDDLLEFYGLSAWGQELDLLITWAVVTYPCRVKLKKRQWFMEQCLKFHEDPEDINLWKGLYEGD